MGIFRISNYNNCLRRLLNIPKPNSVSEMFVNLIIKSPCEFVRNYIERFMNIHFVVKK